MKLIDKDALVAEIERRKQTWQHQDQQYVNGGRDVCDYLLGFLDTLEVKDVDLEKKNMIKVLEEKPVPRETVTCGNCGSILEYGNADLHHDYDPDTPYTGLYRPMCFVCPVCGVKVVASWITKGE